MTEPINLTQLRALTPWRPEMFFRTDLQHDLQVSIPHTNLLALIDIAEAAHEDIKHSIGAGSGAQGLRARARLQAALTKVTP